MIGYTKTLWWTTMAMKYHQTFRCFTCWLLVIFQPGWSQWVNWCQAQHAMLRLMIGYKNPSRSIMGEELYIRDDLKLPRVSQIAKQRFGDVSTCLWKPLKKRRLSEHRFRSGRTYPKNVECGTCGVFRGLIHWCVVWKNSLPQNSAYLGPVGISPLAPSCQDQESVGCCHQNQWDVWWWFILSFLADSPLISPHLLGPKVLPALWDQPFFVPPDFAFFRAGNLRLSLLLPI